ncbi:MAG: hypothetical protein HPZ91_02595 [Lentisphaeria bacterium]|nr:hypothetical protein [Lentisphaeria bacterium]
MSTGRKKFKVPVGFFLILVLFFAAAAAAGYWYLRRSPVRAVELVIGSVKGLEAETVEESAPGRLLVKRLSYHSGGRLVAGCDSAEIELDPSGIPSGVRIRGAEIGQWDSLLPLLAGSTVTKTLPLRLSVDGVFRGAPEERNFPFTLNWKPGKEGRTEVIFSMPDPGVEASGRFNPVARTADLKFTGRVTPELLALFGSRIPTELLLSGSVEAEGELRLDLKGTEPVKLFTGELRFTESTAISGGIWALSPGARAEFRWNGAGDSWEVILPETTLTRPLELPLGALTFSGRENDPEIRFSIVNTPPVGELAGVMRIDGQYNRVNGNWMFRQSESSDRAVRWSGELPLGNFSCIWRSPKISGGGTRSRGSIDFSLGFEALKYRAPGNPQELAALPGTLSGSWNFDYDNAEATSFELAGLLRSSKLDWANPESAWSASSALASFRFSRQAGETSALLVLEPELAGVNLYGGGVPKLKLEGFSGKFTAMIDPAAQEQSPLRVEGAVEVRRVNPVRSMFGAGELKDLRLSGYAELSSGWMVLGLQASGGAENALFRYPECEIAAAFPAFSLKFDRNSIRPGDNFVGRMDSRRMTLSALGGTLAVPKAQAVWSGELRESGLLPDRWRVTLDMPAGTIENRDLTGTFRVFRCEAGFERSQVSGFKAVLDELEARFGNAPAFRLLRAKKQTLAFERGESGASGGAYMLSGGSVFEREMGGGEIAIDLPLQWGEHGAQGSGTFRAGEIALPGNVLREASGRVRLDDGRFKFDGTAASAFWKGDALRFAGDFSWDREWEFSGEYELKPVVLEKPLALDAVLPAASGMTFSGGLSGHGAFGFYPARTDWSCELSAADGALKNNELEVRKLYGTLRLPGSGAGNRNPGGELRFGEITADTVSLRNGALAFRLLRPDECDILSASGSIWGGRARLSAPFTLRTGMDTVEVGVVIRGLEWSGLLREFGLGSGLIDGRADGMLFWRLHADGRKPELASAELTSVGSEQLKLEALEPFVLASESSAARQRIYLDLLRDFNCRALRLRFEEEPAGSTLLSLSAAGRPAGPIKVRDENYRRLIRSVDPAAFGLDGEIEISVNYRIPAKREKKEKK